MSVCMCMCMCMCVCVCVELLAQLQSVCVVGYEPLSEVQRSSNTMSVSVSVSGGTSSTVLDTLHTLLYPTTSFEGE
jgi:hypothetical protein